MDNLTRTKWFREPRRRRPILAGLGAVLAVLCLFPRYYLAVTTLAPQDTSTAGLSAILGQLGGNFAALLGNQQPIEIDLTVGRSYEVQEAVAKALGMLDPAGGQPSAAAVRRIKWITAVNALRGSVVEIRAYDTSPEGALKIAATYSKQFQVRLASLGHVQVEYKRGILNDRMKGTTERLARANAAMDAFRAEHHLQEPEMQLGAAFTQMASLQAELQTDQVELETALKFNTDESVRVKSLRSAIASLQAQLDDAQSRARNSGGLTATGIAAISNEYTSLYLEQKFAQSLFDSYSRYLEGAAIEEQTSDYNMRVLEAPYIDPYYHYNWWAAVLLAGVVIFAVGSEFYIARPPVGSPLPRS